MRKKGRTKRYRSPLVGLTGGIGCGQSSVAEFFESFGAKIINADDEGNKLLLEDTIKKEIISEFGKLVVNKKGNVDRKALAELVFSDENALRKLNSIMHPVMIKEICRKAVQNLRSRKYKMTVVDAALIFEAGMDSQFDYLVTVFSDLDKRIERIKLRDNFEDSDITRRLNSQIPLEKKAQKADFIIMNNGTLEQLKENSKKIFHGILAHFKGNSNI